MAGSVNDDNVVGECSLSTEGLMAGQQMQSGELAEWRSCDQIENGTPSTSPPFWDTDEDDSGPKPAELYGKFTWKIESFSQINKRELRSNAFEVGGYKWYILIYPQGCDVCNHLSLFLCVANHEKLLPGWSHFAQFTIAVVNKDPKKSKYSDTLHRFWKKEHDWGWKKFMELSKVVDGFIVSDTLVIKAQVQVIREKADRPFRCLDCQYRRELVRVYLSNVEQICRRFVEERRGKLCKLIEDRVRWSSFRLFWLGIDENARMHMSRDKKDAILKVVVKHFFIEKEVTSTLVMDSLYSGLKALEWQSEKRREANSSNETEEMPSPIIYVEDDTFVLADDVLGLVERTALEPLPLKDEKGVQSQNQNQNRTKEGSSSEEFSKDSIERDERRLTELGRRTVELFVLAHIFSSRIEVAYQEVVALKRQEELIREEEAAEQAEIELRAKRSAAEKEKRAKKKQAKQKRNIRKGKDQAKDENPDNKPKKGTLIDDTAMIFAEKLEETIDEKVATLDASDDDDGGAVLEDREASPRNWDTDVSEVIPGTDASSSELQHDQHEKKNSSFIDDSSSTCSTDSVPSVVANGTYRLNTLPNNKCNSSSGRGRNRRNRSMRAQKNHIHDDVESLASEAASVTGLSHDVITNSNLEIEPAGSSKDGMELQDVVLFQKQDTSMQSMQPARNQSEESPSISRESVSASSATCLERSSPKPTSSAICLEGSSVKPTKRTDGSIGVTSVESTLKREPATERSIEKLDSALSKPAPERPIEKLDSAASKPLLAASPYKQEAQKFASIAKVTPANDASPVSRPLSAPLTPTPRPNVTLASTSQAMPYLSRSTSAVGRIGVTDSPASSQSYIPQSYRNVLGKSNFAASSTNFVHQPSSSSSSQVRLYSQPSVSLLTPSIAPLHGRMDQTRQATARTGFNFGSVNPKVLNSGNYQTANSSLQTPTSNAYHASSLIDQTANLSIREASSNMNGTETVSGSSARQVAASAADDFPHLDIIDYLFEEEHSDVKTAAVGYNQFGLNRQYTFPGSYSQAPQSSTLHSSSRFDGSDNYFFDTSQGMYGMPVRPFDDTDSSGYTGSDHSGMMLSQWPMSSAENSHIGSNATDHRNGYPYQFQDYSNLTCGMNGFSMYRPANGH